MFPFHHRSNDNSLEKHRLAELPKHVQKADFIGTVLHEVGHSIGSRHDHAVGCNHQVEEYALGPYMMNYYHPRLTGPVRTEELSPCSKRQMLNYLNYLRREAPDNCLARDESARRGCGNGVRESGEECDCGSLCEYDRCCSTWRSMC